MADSSDTPGNRATGRQLQVETHGLDVIADAERKGSPRTLFWPWFGANFPPR
jgi:nucleobase:cation symporter-1, NCS1 family